MEFKSNTSITMITTRQLLCTAERYNDTYCPPFLPLKQLQNGFNKAYTYK